MRKEIKKHLHHDPRMNYRGESSSRFDNLTDAVFGIAITLLIFNLANPNSFTDLLAFTKTLPAFLISIAFLVLVWREHVRFSRIYTLNESGLILLNTLFIALVIFYVYPLRFLSLFLTTIFFRADLGLHIEPAQVPDLMIYYGVVAFGLYFILFLFYHRVQQKTHTFELNEFEVFYTRMQKRKLLIMFSVPLLSIVLVLITKPISVYMASAIGGMIYAVYAPAISIWYSQFKKKSETFD